MEIKKIPNLSIFELMGVPIIPRTPLYYGEELMDDIPVVFYDCRMCGKGWAEQCDDLLTFFGYKQGEHTSPCCRAFVKIKGLQI